MVNKIDGQLERLDRHRYYSKEPTGFQRKKYEPPDELEGCTFTPRIGRRVAPSLYRSKSVGKRCEEHITSWQKRENLDLQECTFQPNLHKVVHPNEHNPIHRPFRTDEKGFNKDYKHTPVASGTSARTLPTIGSAWEWALRSRSFLYGVATKAEMQHGTTRRLFEHEDIEQERDWSAQVR